MRYLGILPASLVLILSSTYAVTVPRELIREVGLIELGQGELFTRSGWCCGIDSSSQ